jgi:hypothetical protein
MADTEIQQYPKGKGMALLTDGAVVGGTMLASTAIGAYAMANTGWRPSIRGGLVALAQGLAAAALAKKSGRIAVGLAGGAVISLVGAAAMEIQSRMAQTAPVQGNLNDQGATSGGTGSTAAPPVTTTPAAPATGTPPAGALGAGNRRVLNRTIPRPVMVGR